MAFFNLRARLVFFQSSFRTRHQSHSTTTTIMAPKELNFITGNKNKLAEVKAILGDTVILKSQALDLLEIQGTIEEISLHKCRTAADLVG